MITKATVQQFMDTFNLNGGSHLSLKRWSLVVTTAVRWHGPIFAMTIADCFTPVGEAVKPGYEDSREGYVFEHPSDEDIQYLTSTSKKPKRQALGSSPFTKSR